MFYTRCEYHKNSFPNFLRCHARPAMFVSVLQSVKDIQSIRRNGYVVEVCPKNYFSRPFYDYIPLATKKGREWLKKRAGAIQNRLSAQKSGLHWTDAGKPNWVRLFCSDWFHQTVGTMSLKELGVLAAVSRETMLLMKDRRVWEVCIGEMHRKWAAEYPKIVSHLENQISSKDKEMYDELRSVTLGTLQNRHSRSYADQYKRSYRLAMNELKDRIMKMVPTDEHVIEGDVVWGAGYGEFAGKLLPNAGWQTDPWDLFEEAFAQVDGGMDGVLFLQYVKYSDLLQTRRKLTWVDYLE